MGRTNKAERNLFNYLKGAVAMNSKYFKMPHREKYDALLTALWDYYELCLPQYTEDERYDIAREAQIAIEDAMRRHYEDKKK